ncbi:hypothetical protein ElyMa_005031100 [Elysia marginata]|uniref:C2H2-type domain-containing protein n=1 Tax=Elysia marginata TaxID=1093978 RepID=A0AAV4J9C8_9GAST|nr:hypothetical protein ElyMa_005031100 [Elysia marginata]
MKSRYNPSRKKVGAQFYLVCSICTEIYDDWSGHIDPHLRGFNPLGNERSQARNEETGCASKLSGISEPRRDSAVPCSVAKHPLLTDKKIMIILFSAQIAGTQSFDDGQVWSKKEWQSPFTHHSGD